jgi:hypothetical protein
VTVDAAVQAWVLPQGSSAVACSPQEAGSNQLLAQKRPSTLPLKISHSVYIV